MRRASLTSSLIAPVIGSESPALSVRSATICMSLSAQVNEIMSHSLSASDAPALDHVGLAADQRQQRSLVRREPPAADRRVEHAHALRLRALFERLDGIG